MPHPPICTCGHFKRDHDYLGCTLLACICITFINRIKKETN